MNQVWVTGGTGFFGRHICAKLGPRALATGTADVDLLDFDAVRRYLESSPFQTIVHAAGTVGGIAFYAKNPAKACAENLRMGLNLLQALSETGARPHVVIISTACAYPDEALVPTPESALFEGYPSAVTDTYGIAKRTLLTIAEGFRREEKLTYSYLIPPTLYGPGDHLEEGRSSVVCALIRRVLEAQRKGLKTLEAWGDGSQTRDLLYVEDAAEGVRLAVEKRIDRGIFNLSSGREASIKELAETVCRAAGFEGEIAWDPTKPVGALRRALDPAKARIELGFEAMMSLEEGVRRTLYDVSKRLNKN